MKRRSFFSVIAAALVAPIVAKFAPKAVNRVAVDYAAEGSETTVVHIRSLWPYQPHEFLVEYIDKDGVIHEEESESQALFLPAGATIISITHRSISKDVPTIDIY